MLGRLVISSLLRKYILTFFLLALVFVGIFTVYNKFIYTFGFTDEGDNISIGKFLLQDKKLYKDIFSQHQPVTYYVSATLQKAAPADNVLLVVRRHRQFIILFSFVWILLLTIRFGYRLLPFFFIIELVKYYFLGHLFLAESLVIYPLVYLFCLWWHVVQTKRMSMFDTALASLSAFFVIFNLVPTIIAVGFLMLSLLFMVRKNNQLLFLLSFPFLLATCLLFLFVPIRDYFIATVWANFAYYIPSSNQYAFQVEAGPLYIIFHALFWPVTYVLKSTNIFAYLQILLTGIWIIGAGLYLIHTKRYLTVLLVYGILVVLNTRPPVDSMIFFHAFHSLPFFAVFVVSGGVFWQEVQKYVNSLRMRVVATVPVLLLFGLLLSSDMYYQQTISERDTPYIQFSNVYRYSDTVRALSHQGDTLAVIPYEELLYWYSGLFPPTRFLFLQSWVYDVPVYREEIEKGLTKHPPTFVYLNDFTLEPYFKTSDYVSLPTTEATHSALFVKKDRLKNISEKQWEDVKRHGFVNPSEKKR